ncbi:MAG: beta strand repeat-containing protein, partial [Planctomycetota bacterium]
MKKILAHSLMLVAALLLNASPLIHAADEVAVNGEGTDYNNGGQDDITEFNGTVLTKNGGAAQSWQFTGDGTNDVIQTTAASTSEVLVKGSVATQSLTVDFDHNVSVNSTSDCDLLWVDDNGIVDGGSLKIDVAAGVTVLGRGTTSDWLVFWLENTGEIEINNAGTIDGNSKEVIKIASDSANLTLNNTGTITAGGGSPQTTNTLQLSSGTHVINNTGTITGVVSMGSGGDTLNVSGSGVIDGAISMGDGHNTLNFVTDNATGWTSTVTSGSGDDKLTITNNSANDWTGGDITMGAGANTLTVSATSTGDISMDAITGGAGNDTVNITGDVNMTDTVNLGDGDNSLTVNSSGAWTAGTPFTLGSGSNTIHLTNSGATAWNFGAISGGAASDHFTFASGPINLTGAGAFALGDGDNTLTFTSGGTVAGNPDITAGSGNDKVTLTNATANNWAFGTVNLGDGDNYLQLTQSSTGSLTVAGYTAGSGSDVIANMSGTSTITNNLTLGASGEDVLYVRSGTLTVTGGAVSMGTGILAGAGNLNVGAAGTVTFNSAGGSIQPGAQGQPGTLTVTGNVTVDEATELMVDVGDEGTDQLVVTNTLTINAGDTLNINPIITGYVVDGASFTVATAATLTNNGTISMQSIESAVLSMEAKGSGNTIVITASRKKYEDAIEVADNDETVASVLTTMRQEAKGEVKDMLDQMDLMSGPELSSAVSELNPQDAMGIVDANHAALNEFSATNIGRADSYVAAHRSLNPVRFGGGRAAPLRGYQPIGPAGPSNFKGQIADFMPGAWSDAYHSFGTQDDMGGREGYDWDTSGIVMGLDAANEQVL